MIQIAAGRVEKRIGRIGIRKAGAGGTFPGDKELAEDASGPTPVRSTCQTPSAALLHF